MSITGYKFDGYTGSDQSFERLQRMNIHRDAAAASTTRAPKPRRRAEPVQVDKVPDEAMRAARALLAGGSYTRIEVRRDGSVIVR